MIKNKLDYIAKNGIRNMLKIRTKILQFLSNERADENKIFIVMSTFIRVV